MKNQLNPLAAALTLGIVWAVGLFLWTFLVMQTGYGQSWFELIAEIYPGVEMSTGGAFLGLLWGFLDGFIGTYILVWIYNFFVRKLGK